ncbi:MULTISPECIES: ferritin-like domain-containing protein [unclassified Meiothermus]|uniref:ferritin-like domain-containing protein n=1 Tax=unclassified Meiothermus TaxID=370471 RepID=UPI000D7BED6C|nr:MULTISPECIES: ferritin-like domain-containing protein [unclassified Meiothermus]PZA07291.1 ferritin-like domain-containing protein [Meiothermus sp. Pnk-1]RYM38025.1 ferritin-like domain-containing protein [Meiothermus sp. PNK-Is4]
MAELNRRQALKQLGVVGTGAVLGGVISGCTSSIAAKANIDVDVLNFALNLEYLEAAFYLAATGRIGELYAAGGGNAEIRFPSGFDGTSPIPGLSDAVRQYADEIATDELAHVKAIRGALGAKAVDRPVLDLGLAFDTAGRAASNGAITGFNPFANELFFLHGAFIFEDVGVTAYKGAARLLTDDSAGGVLDTAAGILAVEAYHAGEIRTLLYARKDQPAAVGLTVEQVTQAISDLRAKVGGGKDQGITLNGKANIVVSDNNGVAFGRSTAEVLAIVYLGGMGKGGFFPNGLNGTIK